MFLSDCTLFGLQIVYGLLLVEVAINLGTRYEREGEGERESRELPPRYCCTGTRRNCHSDQYYCYKVILTFDHRCHFMVLKTSFQY